MRDRGSFAMCGTDKESTNFTPTMHSGPGLMQTPPSHYTPYRPRSSFPQPSNAAFQNPLRKTRSARKQIYVADIEDNGKITAYTSVYVNVSEGTAVQTVASTVQEYINSADSFTICDSKGIVIADTAETKEVEFWKTPSRKIYVIKSSDLVKLQRQDVPSKKRRVEAPEKSMLDSLQGMEEELKVELKKAETGLQECFKEKYNELTVQVNQVRAALGEVVQKLDVFDTVCQRVTDLSANSQVTACLRESLACRMCTGIPSSVVVVTACCGQVAGCGACIQTYLQDNDTCLLCKAAQFSTKLVFLRGLSEVLSTLQ